nr:MAG: internal scaffolding protein [Microvirus sp.]
MTQPKRDPNAMYFDGKDMEGQSAVSVTLQQFMEECDIRGILSHFEKTGILKTRDGNPIYGDFTKIPDFQSAMNTVILANDTFMQLPAAVRDRFQNDPARLMEFLGDPSNQAEAVKLGLAEAPLETAPEPSIAPEGSPTGSEEPVPPAPKKAAKNHD